jgi:hypothetical protein
MLYFVLYLTAISLNLPSVLFFKLPKPFTLFILHSLIVILLLISPYLNYTLTTQWFYQPGSGVNWSSLYYRGCSNSNVFFENVSIVTTLLTLHDTQLNTPNSFFGLYNNLDSQFFALDLVDGLLNQTIYNHTYLYTYSVQIQDTASLVTDLLFCVVISLLIFFTFYKIPIIF